MSIPVRPSVPLSTLLDTLADFQKRFPRPGIDALELSEPYFVESDWPVRGKSIPHSYEAGVYFLFNANDDLLYVGKADGLGTRVGGRFTWTLDGKAGMVKNARHREAGVHSVRTIPLIEEHWFEAASIETFLIDALKPPLNKVGTNRFVRPRTQ